MVLPLLCVVPSQPSDFKGEAKSETSILLSWVAPPQTGPDNQITGYELVYRRPDQPEEVRRPDPVRPGPPGYGSTGGWMDRGMDRWMDGGMDGWMDGWRDG